MNFGIIFNEMIEIIKKIMPKNKKYFFALSMGADSVSGFFYLLNKNYDVHPIHFNHKLRDQNDIMENKFIELCENINKNPIIGYGKNLKTEAECRNARINFYKKECKNSTIITAHHLNDYVESYLLNCFRGNPYKKSFSLSSDFKDFSIIHPFLLTRKKDFNQFLERNNLLNYIVEDETNKIIKGSRRNWIRQIIIPEMKNNKISLEKFAKKKILETLLTE